MWKAILPMLFVGSLAGAMQAPTAADLQKLGPQVGQRVADFSLVDQFGASRNLASVMGKNGLMLVFFRSADW